jgi:hypothetical protein
MQEWVLPCYELKNLEAWCTATNDAAHKQIFFFLSGHTHLITPCLNKSKSVSVYGALYLTEDLYNYSDCVQRAPSFILNRFFNDD